MWRIFVERVVCISHEGPKEQMGSQIRIIANQALTLRDGTPAYRTDAKWIFK